MNAPTPETILKLAQEIVETRNRLTLLEQQWAAYFPNTMGDGLIASKSKAVRKGGKQPDPSSIRGRIFRLIDGSPSHRYNAGEVSKLLNIDQKQAERSLFKLHKLGKILRPERGIFQGKGTQKGAQEAA